MNKINVFETEFQYIKSSRILENAKKLVEQIPDYFFEIAASSTGKYHPAYALGEGGLVRHTKAAVRIAHELLENESIGSNYTNDEKDIMIVALILHDSCKSGRIKSVYTVVDHPLLAAQMIREQKENLTLTEEEMTLLCTSIESHMGPWNKDFKGNVVLPVPNNKYQKFIHMCDFLASKKFIAMNFKENEIQD